MSEADSSSLRAVELTSLRDVDVYSVADGASPRRRHVGGRCASRRAAFAACASAAAVIIVLLVLFVAPHPAGVAPPGAPPAGPPVFGHTVVSSRGVVSTTHIDATRAGIAALAAGGNAVDAGAVVQFMLAVVQPQSTGIGGGCVILGVDPAGGAWALDGREEAPAAFRCVCVCVRVGPSDVM